MSEMLDRYLPSRSSLDFVDLRTRIIDEIWMLVNRTLFRMLPRQCRGWRRMLLRAFGCRIGRTSAVGRTALIERPWNLVMGERSSIGEQAWVFCLDRITIGDKVCIGPGVRLITGSHDISSPVFYLVTKPIKIESGVWVANYASVLPGIVIGEGAVVGTGAVVTKPVNPWTVVAGNPARVVKRRELKFSDRDAAAHPAETSNLPHRE